MLAALLSVGLFVHLGLDDWYRHTVHRESLPERKEHQYAELRGEVDTLIFGDSHALSGVDPDVLGAAFDFGLPTQFPPKVYGLLAAKIAEPDVQIERIVLQADLHTFWRHPETGFQLRYYAPVVDYLALGRQRGEALRFGVLGWVGRFAPYIGKRTLMLGYLARGFPPELAWLRNVPLVRGSIKSDNRWLDRSEEERIELAAERVVTHFHFGEEFDDVAASSFRRILDLARSRGIGVVVVQYPVSTEYLFAAGGRIDIATHDRKLRGLLTAYPEVRQLMARRLFAQNPEYFSDPDHINRQGARELSQHIRVELDALEASGRRGRAARARGARGR